MEGLNALQIATGIGGFIFLFFALVEGAKKASENLGWATKRAKKRRSVRLQQEENRLQQSVQKILETIIDEKITPKFEEQRKCNEEQSITLGNLIESSNDLMRHEMTKIYYKYLPYKRILLYDKESFCKLYKDYHTQHGNTFIDTINREMAGWSVVLEEKDLTE